MCPVTVAEKSGPVPPTVSSLLIPPCCGRNSLWGVDGLHFTSCHCLSGYVAVKQPVLFGGGVVSIPLRHSFRAASIGFPVAVCAGCVGVSSLGCAAAGKGTESPDRRLAKTMMPKVFSPREN